MVVRRNKTLNNKFRKLSRAGAIAIGNQSTPKKKK